MAVRDFVKNTWKPLSLKMRRATHLEWGHQAVISAEIIRELREAEADKIYSSNSLHF